MTPPNVALYEWIRRTFDFKGRSTRAHFWWPFLFSFVVQFMLVLLFVSSVGPDVLQSLLDWVESRPSNFDGLDIGPLPSLAKFVLTFLIVVALLTFVPNISVSWRRFQDMNRPGWLHLIFLVGRLVGGGMLIAIVELIWFAFPGTNGPNRFGPDRVVR
ncbi:MAG: DUF805 domain-containing protein [Pseudomonadota bacterium]